MEILEIILESRLIISVLSLLVAFIVGKGYLDKYKKEFKTFVKITEIIADRHNIGIVDYLYQILEEAGKTEEFTYDMEKLVHEEIDELEKKQSES